MIISIEKTTCTEFTMYFSIISTDGRYQPSGSKMIVHTDTFLTLEAALRAYQELQDKDDRRDYRIMSTTL